MINNELQNETMNMLGFKTGMMFSQALITIVLCVVVIIAMYKLFKKAGEAGWKAIIPIYNLYILYKITWGNGLLFLLLLIPFVNIVISIITYYKLAKAFGYGLLFTIGLLFIPWIFLLILGFGSAEYHGNQKE